MISIVIVNHNTAKILSECINSILKFENYVNFEIFIIDNHSEENIDVLKQFERDYTNIHLICLENLMSFSYANNIGIKKSKGEYILIMNPDIIFTEAVLSKLINSINTNTKIGAISPLLIGSNGKFQRNYFQKYPNLKQFILFYSILSKFFISSGKLVSKYLEDNEIDLNQNKIFYVDQIPFAFFLTSRNTLKLSGLPDENFKLFFEDVDLSYRIAQKFKLAIDTSLKVTHLGGSSMKKENYKLYGLFINSMIYFFRKHYSRFKYLCLITLVKSNSHIIILFEYIKKVFGKQDQYRLLKHQFNLKLLKSDQ